MKAWITNNLHDIVQGVREENTTEYLKILDEVCNYEAWDVKDYLDKLTGNSVNKLSNNQAYTLFAMGYKGNYNFNYYRYNNNQTTSLFEDKVYAICKANRASYYMDMRTLTKEDLPYVSQYYRNQWKKENGTGKRVTKGLDAKIAMDEFSLIMFKESIDKPFNQTVGKNYVMAVNKAYHEAGNKIEHVKLRNKFYKLILDNTTTHSKAMINQIAATTLIHKDYSKESTGKVDIYDLEPDETVAIHIGYGGGEFMPFIPRDAMNSYADDLTVVIGNKNVTKQRDQYRYAAAASLLINIYHKTGKDLYKDKALEILDVLDDEIKESIINDTDTITTLNSILKQGTNK